MRARFPRDRVSTLEENFLSLDHRYGGGGVSINNIYNQSTFIKSFQKLLVSLFSVIPPLFKDSPMQIECGNLHNLYLPKMQQRSIR